MRHIDVIQQTLQMVNLIAPAIGHGIVPVWWEKDINQRHLIGTAFFVERHQRQFLVTALHNFTDNPGLSLKINFLGSIWTLSQMASRKSECDDLWLGEPDVDLCQQLRNITVPLLLREDPVSCKYGTGAVLMGCPYDLNSQGEPFSILPISAALDTRDELTISSTLPESLIYHVPNEFLTTAEGMPVMPQPAVSGMSGGPAFSWIRTDIPGSDTQELKYFLQGMIVAWQPRKGYVVACNAARIAALAT